MIVTDPPGYRIVLEERHLDLIQFNALLERARTAAGEGRVSDAVEDLQAGVDLWRGPILSEVHGAPLEAAAGVLNERWLTANEKLLGMRLDSGQAAESIGELRQLVETHPYRETLRSLLLLALYRSGRQAEAVREFASFHAMLAEELGVGPGPELVSLHELILHNSPELLPCAGKEPDKAFPPQDALHPHNLPYDLTDFNGRKRELCQILDQSSQTSRRGPRIVVIDGMGGSGKTALAVHAAHRLADEYSDGQLYLDLRAFDPDEETITPEAALGILLRAAGIPGADIADDIHGREAQWRRWAAHKSVILVLDNVVNATQVRQLIPPSPGSFVIVASRSRIVELDGAESISLGMLSPDESAELLTRLLGQTRVMAEPEATEELAALCGHLPLALRVVAARLAKRRHWTVRHLAERLRDKAYRLDELNSGDRSVAAALGMSYEMMPTTARDDFRLLCLHPGAEFDVQASAALLGADVAHAEETLEYLLDVHLLQQWEHGRYSFHDLVKAFARALPADSSERCVQERAEERLVLHYHATIERVCDILFPGRVAYTDTPVAMPDIAVTPMADANEALDWLDSERAGLTSVIELANRQSMYEHVARIGRALSFCLHGQGCYAEFEDVAWAAVTAARSAHDPMLLCVSLVNLSVAQWQRDQLRGAVDSLQEALELATALSNAQLEAACLSRLGVFTTSLGNLRTAKIYLVRAAEVHFARASAREEAEALTNLCFVNQLMGDHDSSLRAGERAVDLARGGGDQSVEITALANLAKAHLGRNELGNAARHLSAAWELCRKLRIPSQTALVLMSMAELRLRAGRHEDALACATTALDIVRESCSVSRQAAVENLLGSILREQGKFHAALRKHSRAARLSGSIGLAIERARAFHGLAIASTAMGRIELAARWRTASRDSLGALGLPRGFFWRAEPSRTIDIGALDGCFA
ncbi:BTAD domain-containing putative transcriptional regulator [Streptomyces sp. NPDC026665]|uniref:ATP-binding protein n=1 Tax=Streptomyces sp. NPDC026665 TaxID=3154798 RepID=UPI00340B2531